MKRLHIALFGCAAFLIFCNASGCKSKSETPAKTESTPSTTTTATPAPAETPAPTATAGDAPLVKVHTKFGDMTIMLYNETPKHRDNFLKLVNEKFYDNLLFHRCIKGFMIQGGDPQSRGAAQGQMLGSGGPGYTIPAEFNANLVHKRGALCAARQGDQVNPKKESSGSQFYIVQGQTWTDMQLGQIEMNIGRNMPGFKYTDAQKQAYKTVGGTAQLDMDYTVFGEVIEGMAVIDSINNQKTMRDRPLSDITMSMEVIKKERQVMQEAIQKHLAEIAAHTASTPEAVEQFRIHYLGRKGILNDLFETFKTVPGDQKKALGQELNKLKIAVQEKLESLQAAHTSTTGKSESLDWSRPTGALPLGTRHPLAIVRQEILDIFSRIGFTVADGPEIEDDWHVFSGLNFPPEHPARDMQDTFFIHKPTNEGEKEMVLRTHTSSVQVRAMENQKPPLRIVMPGRVYRNEAVSSRAHCQFHQIEGLYIDEGVSFADMKQTLQYFTQEFFGKAKIRLRPSYFPFTEPSAEMDVYWGLNSEADYRITKGTGWLEIMGCGMVDPAVLSASGIDPERYSGFAFGMGIERITMLRYQIDDLRMFFENDVRFLRQFQG